MWLLNHPRQDGLDLLDNPSLGQPTVTSQTSLLDPELTPRILRPGTHASIQDRIVWALRTNLKDGIETRLAELSRSASLPRLGSIVVFSSGLRFSICCSYQTDPRPTVEILSICENPRSFGEVMSTASGADQRLKLRRASLARLKMCYHRGTLTVVDRYDEDEVFGPSIDTLILAEVLAQTAEARTSSHVLEVGSGSGAIIAGIAQHEPVTSLLAIDYDYTSLKCTNRNVERAALIGNPSAQRFYLTGPFDPGLLRRRYDLLICNPPYLPTGGTPRIGDYGLATQGTKLLLSLLQNLPYLLQDDGLALIIVPNWLLAEATRSIPSGWRLADAIEPSTIEVLFEVEAVMFDRRMFESMLASDQITQSGGIFYHRLHPIWLARQHVPIPPQAMI
jgi:tRNA1(Val) A37 N6-methylase TrmN6